MISKSNRYRLFVLLILAGLFLAACGGAPTSAAPANTQENSGSDGGQTPSAQQGAYPASPESGYPGQASAARSPVQVVTPEGNTVTLDDARLSNLVTAEVNANNQKYTGFLLSTILKAAGVNDFSQVIISGASNNLTLTKDKVGSDTLVAFTETGLPELVSGSLSADQWVTEIKKIEVK